MSKKRVLVTGAAGYVGQEIVEVFKEAGYSVLGIDKFSNSEDDINSNVKVLTNGLQVDADVTKSTDMTRVTKQIEQHIGGLDILVCNAGIMDSRDGGIFEVPEDVWDRTITANVTGTWQSIRACLPYLLESDAPAVVIIGSLVALRGSAEAQLAYTASKGAISALARELAVSLAVHGIRVNCVCPGPLDGGLLKSRTPTAEDKGRRTEFIPLGRLGTARDVAEACLFLASEKSSYISGVELVVDGGAAAAFIVR